MPEAARVRPRRHANGRKPPASPRSGGPPALPKRFFRAASRFDDLFDGTPRALPRAEQAAMECKP